MCSEVCVRLDTHVEFAWGDHTPLRFVTTCDNGVFNERVFMHLTLEVVVPATPLKMIVKVATSLSFNTYFLETMINEQVCMNLVSLNKYISGLTNFEIWQNNACFGN